MYAFVNFDLISVMVVVEMTVVVVLVVVKASKTKLACSIFLDKGVAE